MMIDPIHIFVGTSANNEDSEAEMVLEYTLRKNSTLPLNIHWMRQSRDGSGSIWGGWETQRWSTPFSGFRWAIPEARGFTGRAIYMDVDQLNLKDIAELYSIDLQGKPLAARRGKRFGGHEFCVIVMDCEKLGELVMPVTRMKQNVDAHHRYIGMFSGNDNYVAEMDPRWNCHDGDGRAIDDIWHLHYTEMATQPWKPAWFTGQTREHPRQDLVKLWHDMRAEAVLNGCAPVLNNNTYGDYNIIGR
jgi:lipopolysaccharide biosynthesis glycosyltransferase